MFTNCKTSFRILSLFSILLVVSCGKVPEIVSPDPPVISLDREEPVYRVKVNEPLTITPTVENAGDNAAYRWSIDGAVVGNGPSFTFVGVEPGSVYLIFEVINDNGQAEKEVRIDVAPVKFPTITMVVPPNGFSLLVGEEMRFEPQVNNAAGSQFEWKVDGKAVSGQQDYVFRGETAGDHALSFTASNEDGSDSVEFTVRVCTEEQMAFGWKFEQTVYNVSLGRTVYIRPYCVENAFDAVYTWTVNGEAVDAPKVETSYAGRAPECILAFTPKAPGTYEVKAVMTNSYVQKEQSFTVNCCPAEGAYRRVASGASKAAYNKVYEFKAAAGQFVNERYAAADMQAACLYAEGRMQEKSFVSLGAFGGYMVVGFDHSIDNDGGYNIRVDGNSFIGSSEPGIVWVMQDENGNGLPDDTWYELKGSEYGGADTRLDYAVTYYRPASPGQPVAWTDNEGVSGVVDYMPAFHSQDYYYPAWVAEDSYTLIGRKLKPRVEMITENYWVNHEYEWGYADNFSPVDRLTDDDNHNADVNGNHFKISDAVTYEGQPANLEYVDFVKIQTGVQAKAGWLGELSTEVFGVSDFNLLKQSGVSGIHVAGTHMESRGLHEGGLRAR